MVSRTDCKTAIFLLTTIIAFSSCTSSLDVEASRRIDRYTRDDAALGYKLSFDTKVVDFGIVPPPALVEKKLLIINIAQEQTGVWKAVFRRGNQGFSIAETASPFPRQLTPFGQNGYTVELPITFSASTAGFYSDTLDFYDIQDNRIPASPVICNAHSAK